MKIIKRITAVFTALMIIAGVFSGCAAKDEKIDFIYPFEGKITSFDPQVASSSDEFLIAENCYEGLIRINDDGSIQAGVAESWSKSADGKTYIFNLRKGAKWHIQKDGSVQELMGTEFNPDITAHDFVFAFRRTAEKNTASPLFSSISNIVNANSVNSGKMKSNKLGVKAVDDYTLEIKLKSADDNFMNVLSTAAAMPCNEDYFNATKGRYGLGLDYSLFNGQFYVSSILESSYILKNNEQYIGDFPSKVSDVTLKIVDENEEIAKKLEDGYYDCAYISGSEYELLKGTEISAVPYCDKTWAFVLNNNNFLFGNENLRRAVSFAVSNIDLGKISYLSPASNYVPPSCIIGNQPANKAIGKTAVKQDAKKAMELWRKGLEETGITQANLKVAVPKNMESFAKELVQGIQGSVGRITSYGTDSKVSFSLKIEALGANEFDTAIAKGEYDIALYPFTATSHSPVSYFAQIVKSNFAGESKTIEKSLKNAQKATASNLASACAEFEKELVKNASIIPVLYESSYYAQAKGVSGVQFHPGSGRVCFVNATREN